MCSRKRCANAWAGLDDSLEHEKGPNPFLEGVEAVVEAIAQGRIECRVYRKDKFHAKAYITHAKFDVLGAQALVGSSNFTRPGLTRNVELNIKVESGREVAQLQDWFETHWAAAEDVTEDVLRTITRHTADFMPFDVYAKALHEFFRGSGADCGGVGRVPVPHVRPSGPLPAGGVLVADEDCSSARRGVPLRWSWPGQDVCGADADRAARAAREQEGGVVRSQGGP